MNNYKPIIEQMLTDLNEYVSTQICDEYKLPMHRMDEMIEAITPRFLDLKFAISLAATDQLVETVKGEMYRRKKVREANDPTS
jgi:hypothetical protein